MNERPIPIAAQRDANSVEIARIWIADNKLNCSMKIGMYEEMGKDEPFAWGVILADVAKHVANAMKDFSKVKYEDTLATVLHSFVAELERPTSKPDGAFKTHS